MNEVIVIALNFQ